MAKFQKRQLASDTRLGEQLKEVRQTAKLSLDQVAAATKIRKQFIKALEAGDYEAFPAEVYLRGFLENYAAFLGFPQDEVLLQYKRERGITGAPTGKRLLDVPQNRPNRISRFSITPRTLWYTAGALGLVIVIGYLASQVFTAATPPKLEVYRPAANATITTETVEVEGRTDSGAQLAINNQPIPTDPDGGFKEKVRILPGANTIRVTAANKAGKQRVVTRQLVANIPGLASPSPVASPSGLLFTVKIGPDSAYVTINVDGQDAFTGLLLPNTEQSFIAAQRILLTTSNAGSTRVLLNGQDQGVVGNDGQYRRGIEYLAAPSPTPSAPAVRPATQ